MLSFVVPVLDDEFPLLPADLRDGVLSVIPYNAALVEQGIVREYGVAIDPGKRIELWTEIMRETARGILARHAPNN